MRKKVYILIIFTMFISFHIRVKYVVKSVKGAVLYDISDSDSDDSSDGDDALSCDISDDDDGSKDDEDDEGGCGGTSSSSSEDDDYYDSYYTSSSEDDGSGCSCTADVAIPVEFYAESHAIDAADDHYIRAFGTDFYMFSTPDPANYTISLTNLSSDLRWTLYQYNPSNLYKDQIKLYECNENIGDPGDEVKILALSGPQTYLIKVEELDNIDSYFELTIQHE